VEAEFLNNIYGNYVLQSLEENPDISTCIIAHGVQGTADRINTALS
jgi:hypothetical protein